MLLLLAHNSSFQDHQRSITHSSPWLLSHPERTGLVNFAQGIRDARAMIMISLTKGAGLPMPLPLSSPSRVALIGSPRPSPSALPNGYPHTVMVTVGASISLRARACSCGKSDHIFPASVASAHLFPEAAILPNLWILVSPPGPRHALPVLHGPSWESMRAADNPFGASLIGFP